MKKYLYSIAILIGITCIYSIPSASASNFLKTIKGDKKIITKELKISDYESILLKGSADVIYEQKGSTPTYLTVEIDNNLLEYIDIQVENKKLSIGTKTSVSISPTKFLVRTNSKVLTEAIILGSGNMSLIGKLESEQMALTIKGSGDITGNKIITSSLNIEIKGSGNITLSNINAQKTTAQIKGSGDIKLEGTSSSVAYSTFGSGNINAKQLIALSGTASTKGSGDIDIYSKQTLDCNIQGSGDISYYGAPTNIQKSIKGSGDIKKAE